MTYLLRDMIKCSLYYYTVTGNINITGSNYTITNATNYNILGQDPYAEQLTSIQINSQELTVSSGNVQIVSPNNNFTISANNYSLDGNINISEQIKAINANTIQIYSDTQYAITNSQPYLIIGNTYNIQNNSIYPKITILGNSTIQSSQPYIINSSTINPYSIDGNTYIS